MPHTSSEDANFVISRYKKAKAARDPFENVWEDIRELTMPGRTFSEEEPRPSSKVFDSTAPRNLSKLAAAIQGLMTNPATKWFNFRFRNPSMRGSKRVKQWKDLAVNETLHWLASPESGFPSSSHELYMEYVGLGTGVMALDLRDGPPRFLARPLDEIFLEPDENADVQAVFRRFRMDIWDAVDRWGRESMSPEINRRIDQGEDLAGEKITIIHGVFPRKDRDPERIDAINKPIASVWVDLDNEHTIHVSGFDRFPFLAPRWSKAPGVVYGVGQGLEMLADVAMVNAMRKTNIEAGEKAVDPPLMAQVDMIEGPVQTDSGSLIYTRPGSRDPIKPLQSGGRVDLGEQMLERERLNIGSGFFMDLLQLPELDRMTATEVTQRVQQRLVFMAPIISRLSAELLAPAVNLTFHGLMDTGVIPEPPDEVRGEQMEIDFVSMLAKSQRASEAQAFKQWLSDLAPLAQADPGILDWIDTDELPQISGSEWHGVPERLIRQTREVAQIRQQRNQQLRQQQQLEQAQQAAEAAEAGSEAIRNTRET